MKFLKNVMLINALSSGATGIGLLVFAPFVAEWFGTMAVASFQGTGLFLLCFAALVLFEGVKDPMRPARVSLIILLDTLWVIASLAIVLLQLFHLSIIGYALIAAVAVWVATMAYLQNKGLKQLTMAS